MTLNLSTNIANIELESCIYNASGVNCTTLNELNELDGSSAGALVCKSSTLKFREGNPHPRYWGNKLPNGFVSINSTGLANESLEFYSKLNFDKPYFISIAGLSDENNLKMFEHIEKSDTGNYCAIEFNLSCPNVIGKPQTGYDFEKTEDILTQVSKIYSGVLGVKLPAYFDTNHFTAMAEILNKFDNIKFVTCVNSLGNGLIIDDETVTIKPKNGFGGIGGSSIKPIALSNVRHFYTLLPNKSIVGCGGVMTGRDVFEHILCGASAVQIGTTLKEEGVKCFDRIEGELKQIMCEKGYTTLDDFRGKLKFL
jgi:dihydroorotate dehydrogenase (fumarate)